MRANDHLAGDIPALPQLEQLLVRSARRRSAPGRARRWVLAVAVASLVLVGGAAAATGVIHIADGTTQDGSYSIEAGEPISAEVSEEAGSICLQLRFNDGAPAYGCGDRPSASDPFGLVIADSLDGSAERVIYGLVANDIATIAVLPADGDRTTAPTEAKESLPGRFFSVVVPNDNRVNLVGYDSSGKQVAEIGGLAQLNEAPRSRQQAIEKGDPAGFAPTAPPPSSLTYEGRPVTPAEVEKLNLSCLQGREEMRCYDSTSEAEEAK